MDNIDSLKGVAQDDAEKVKDAVNSVPGAAINVADDDKVNECLQKQRTSQLNNNPRNTDGPSR